MQKQGNVIGSWAKHWVLVAAAVLAACVGVVPSAEAQARGGRAATVEAAPASSEGVVNIQTASTEELQRLPGIGPSKATAIVTHREHNPFRRVEDIMRVRGIGRATFRRLRPYLSVSGQTTLATDVGRPRPARVGAEEPSEAEE